ncbi:ATP phosphoribosyltransferase [Antricoccus suffuscus]|uniref:ATP phosphoribosyltransferase n=1 Tax=Antricoccus suffuscus TaxID=1629062 RepID=A0A2T0ZWN5_9ACTN|nr:ATP phosphoribosyltransferase [Antricoccus suffuscus]PRZ40667.1 ATP phosphoribosyltransferase [Antricoccus suffuscus]
MLRIAVPNKGSLAEAAATIFREAGYRQRTDSKELAILDPENGVEFFYLRPRDIAIYVGEGTLDLGVTGKDLLIDSGTAATEVLPLGFGASTFRLAAMPGTVQSLEDLAGKRIATAYPGVMAGILERSGVDATVVGLDGAVETAIRLGVADAVADVVQTGTTLRTAGLEIVGEPLLESEALLIGHADRAEKPQVVQLTRRLQNVLVARRYVMLDYDVKADVLEAACALTPGLQSPTVSPLHRDEWYAVRSMVPSAETNAIMDKLWDLGARAILVTDIVACRI